MLATLTDKTFSIDTIRKDFPILHQNVYGKPLVYLDNAATTQKPTAVVKALEHYYYSDNANIHRGAHALADRATRAFEDTRCLLQSWFNAAHTEEIIFTKGTTDGINLVASSYGRHYLNKGDEILISTMEHHSNIVPWQMICQQKGAILKVMPINEKGEILLDEALSMIGPKTKLVSMVHVSNALGTINPIKEIIAAAHENGAHVFIDGAQSASHLSIDVQAMDCDFFVCSAHKMYGPTGIGILYGKKSILEQIPPYQGGGEMIKEVSFEKTTYNDLPYKFEAGTPNIADVIAFKAALEYMNGIGLDQITQYEYELATYTSDVLHQVNGLTFYGEAENKTGVFSFHVNGMHHFDIGMMLDSKGIAVRTGHHCTQPLMKRFGIDGTVRASFTFYNTKEEADFLANSLSEIVKKVNK